MTTTTDTPLGKIRHHMNALTLRRDWLLGTVIPRKTAAGDPHGHEDREAAALSWALEIGQAEYDRAVQRRRAEMVAAGDPPERVARTGRSRP